MVESKRTQAHLASVVLLSLENNKGTATAAANPTAVTARNTQTLDVVVLTPPIHTKGPSSTNVPMEMTRSALPIRKHKPPITSATARPHAGMASSAMVKVQTSGNIPVLILRAQIVAITPISTAR